MDPELRVERVSKVFGTRVVLDGVNLSLDGTGLLAIVGEPGSGKSTLARVLAGVERPSSGTVTFDGRDLTGLLQTRRGRAVFRRAVQYLPPPQTPRGLSSAVSGSPFGSAPAVFGSSFDQRRSVRDGLRLTLRVVARISGRMADERIDTTLRELGLAPDVAELLPAQLTGDQHHRCVLARALLPEPRLLICDEVRSLALLLPYRQKHGIRLAFFARELPAGLAVDRLIVLHRGRVAAPAPDRVAA